MAKQRQLLNVRLGLDVASKIGIDLSGIFTNEDLTTSCSATQENNIKLGENHVRVSDNSLFNESPINTSTFKKLI